MMNASTKIPNSLLEMIDSAMIEIQQGKLGQGFESETESVYSDQDRNEKTDALESTMKQVNEFHNGLPSALPNDEMHYDDTLKPDQCILFINF